MSDIEELLNRLRMLDVRTGLDGDRLTVSAPKGALSAALREELGRRRDEIKAYLKSKGATADSRRPRAGQLPLVRLRRDVEHPLSHNQQRLWFVRQMNPGSTVYNIPSVVRFEGHLDEGAMERALRLIIERHDSLRTRFVVHDGVPRCVVEPVVDFRLERKDFSQLPVPESNRSAMSASQEVIERPFDLSRPPLVHAGLVRVAENEWLLTLVLDHIIADGLSFAVLIHDLVHLYSIEVGVALPALEPLEIQYLDYVDWERRCFDAGALEVHRTFWMKELENLPELVTMPTDRPRPPVQTSRGARHMAEWPPELTAALKEVARLEGATLFMVLLAAFQALVYRHTGEADIPIGSAIANRNRAEVEKVVGFFANNIVLRGNLSGNPTVRELIARTRDSALNAYAHKEMPFDALVDALVRRRALESSPLFQIMFVLHGGAATEQKLPGLVGSPVEIGTETARFDLAVDIFDLPAGLKIYFEYNSDLYDAATVNRWAQQYRTILDGLAASLEQRIDSLRLLGADDEQRLMILGNGSRQELRDSATIHGLFEEQARKTPQSIAVAFDGETVTYERLNARANVIGAELRRLGVGRGSLVGLWCNRSVDMIAAVLGVLKAGGAYVPLDPSFPMDRLEFMMADAGLAAIITETTFTPSLPKSIPAALVLDDGSLPELLQAENLQPLARANDLAYVIYTSGSTGKPKGVMLEHRSVVNFLQSMHQEPGIAATDRLVAVTTLSFDIAGLEIHGPLTVGGTVVLASRATALDGVALSRLMDESEATILQATPATWRVLIESGWRGRKGLKMLCGGEALPRDLAATLLDLGGELWNMYGPTETTIWSTIWRVRDASRTIPVGLPIANTDICVLEASGLPAPIGVVGELCIGGYGVARGYLNRDELTAEKFVELDLPTRGRQRVYRTGDLARWRGDGALEFIGRKDGQVKVRGYRIELGEIEAVLAAHEALRQCAVIVREDVPGDHRLVAYVVSVDGLEVNADSMRSLLRRHLPEYMVPVHFVTLPALPLTPNGKVDRRALPAPASVDFAAPGAEPELMNDVQQKVASLWCEVLGVKRVGLNDNFFDLGGYSILLVRLQAGMKRVFGRDVSIVSLFQNTTVAAQAAHLSAATGSDAALQRARARAALQLKA